jgi:hypothetical protein
MYLTFKRLAGCALLALSCGSPGELDRSQFPTLQDTGYADVGGAGGVGTSGSGGGATLPLGGTGGGSGTAGTGAGGTGTGTGGTGTGVGGAAGSAGTGGTGAQPSGNCPDDILVLFNRPGPAGGCGGIGCHIPGGTVPDLTSPGVETRLLNVLSSCNQRPFIGAADSFLEEKLVGTPPACGLQMPFAMANALSAADEQCIIAWIDEVVAGM